MSDRKRLEYLIRETAQDDWDDAGTPKILRGTWERVQIDADFVVCSVSSKIHSFLTPGEFGGVNVRFSNDSDRYLDAEIIGETITFSTSRDEGLRNRGILQGRKALVQVVLEFFDRPLTIEGF